MTLQNHWVSGLLEFEITRKHNVSETVSVSVVRWEKGKGREHLLCWVSSEELTSLNLSSGLNKVSVAPPLAWRGKRSSFRNFVFSSCLEYRTMEEVRKPNVSQFSLAMNGFTVLRDVSFLFYPSNKNYFGGNCLTLMNFCATSFPEISQNRLLLQIYHFPASLLLAIQDNTCTLCFTAICWL
jgi:hypothetical protein